MRPHLSSFALLLTSCFLAILAAGQDPIVSREGNNIIYGATYDATWEALLQSLAEANIHPRDLDKASGLVLFETEATWADYWGGVNYLVRTMTSKEVSPNSTWQVFLAKGNVFCKRLADNRTAVIATFQFFGYNGWAAWLGGPAAGWQQLASSGWLEDWIFKKVRQKLQEGKELEPEIKSGDPSLVERTERLLHLLRKIDAAYKIGAEPQIVSEALIEAQAEWDDFAAAPMTAPMPKFKEQVGHALEAFKRVRTAPEPMGQLTAAREAFDLAAKYLESYRSSSVEASPVRPEDFRMITSSESEPQPDQGRRQLLPIVDPATATARYSINSEAQTLKVEVIAKRACFLGIWQDDEEPVNARLAPEERKAFSPRSRLLLSPGSSGCIEILVEGTPLKLGPQRYFEVLRKPGS